MRLFLALSMAGIAGFGSAVKAAAAERAVYEAPKGGKTATLVVQNESDWPAYIELYLDGKHCRKRRMLLKETGAFTKKTFIPAPGAIAMMFQVTQPKPGQGICPLMFAFEPQPGGTYLATVRVGDDGKKCHLQLIRLFPDGVYSTVDFWLLRYRDGGNDNGSFCTDQRVLKKNPPEDTGDENEADDVEGEPKK